MYVIYDVDNGRSKQNFATLRAAKISLAALKRKELLNNHPRNWAVMSREQYDAEINIMVERINYMTGKPFMERFDTPNHCSPSSETYWST